MSLYTEWLNEIKTSAEPSWLTHNQSIAYENIVKKWQSHPFICLYGAAGCGKSFIARLLCKYHDYTYSYSNLNETPANSRHVVLDDANYSRNLRAVAQTLGLGRVLLLMRQAPREVMPSWEIRLTHEDVDAFISVLHRHKILTSLEQEYATTNLDNILQQEARRKMGI